MPCFALDCCVRGVSFHFSKANRLIKAEEFKKVFADSKRLKTVGLVLLYRTNELGHSRLGLAISKKHLKGAVQRNLVKRIIRENFRQWPSLTVGIDIVFLSRGPIVNANREQIHRQLGQLWEKLNKQHSE